MRIIYTAEDVGGLEGWEKYEGEPSQPADGDVYIARVDEDFIFQYAHARLQMHAGDYMAMSGSLDKGFTCWPVPADELPNSDGRVLAANRVIAREGAV